MLKHQTESSWVYIFIVTGYLEPCIGLTFNIFNRFNKADALEKLIYYRSFSDPFDALAHKHLLDSLSIETVMHRVKQMNPSLDNLIPEISDD